MKEVKYREALQNSTLEPSKDSWKRLEKKLNRHEKKKRHNYAPFFKYAAVILILVSLGIYFFQPGGEIKNMPEIAAPSFDKNLISTPQVDDVPKTEVATSTKILTPKETTKKKVEAQSKTGIIQEERIAYKTVEPDLNIPETIVAENLDENVASGTTSGFEEGFSDEQAIEDEIDQLLQRSKIKLNTGSPEARKIVNADVLLNEIEDDLDKALKQKLFEKIINTVKNPKEAVSYQDN